MNEYVALVVCVGLALLARSLAHSYFYLPEKELKRKSSHGSPGLKKLQLVTEYGSGAKIILGFLTFLFAAFSVVIIARHFSLFAALILLALLAFGLRLASTKEVKFAVNLASAMAPKFSAVLRFANPVLSVVARILPTGGQAESSSEIYEKDDLKDVIKQQKKAPSNRIPDSELDSALLALDFEGKKIKDYLVKRKDIHFVTAKEPIGPILISELHKSGFSCFPVKGNSENEVIGMLHMNEVAKHTEGGVVSEAMDSEVRYVQQDKGLDEVLKAFIKTGKGVFIVVDDQKKLIGLITVKDVLGQMTGQPVDTDFEEYDDPSAVASS